MNHEQLTNSEILKRLGEIKLRSMNGSRKTAKVTKFLKLCYVTIYMPDPDGGEFFIEEAYRVFTDPEEAVEFFKVCEVERGKIAVVCDLFSYRMLMKFGTAEPRDEPFGEPQLG